MALPFYWVDAFTDRVFAGNPAGVCPLTAWLDDQLLQKLAWQHGLSETAFFVRTGERHYHLRWFTPTTEVEICGHATLASAHVLFNELHRRGGELWCALSGERVHIAGSAVTYMRGHLEAS